MNGWYSRSVTAAKISTAYVLGGAPAAAGADPFTYYVQAGAFRTPEDAEDLCRTMLRMAEQRRTP